MRSARGRRHPRARATGVRGLPSGRAITWSHRPPHSHGRRCSDLDASPTARSRIVGPRACRRGARGPTFARPTTEMSALLGPAARRCARTPGPRFCPLAAPALFAKPCKIGAGAERTRRRVADALGPAAGVAPTHALTRTRASGARRAERHVRAHGRDTLTPYPVPHRIACCVRALSVATASRGLIGYLPIIISSVPISRHG